MGSEMAFMTGLSMLFTTGIGLLLVIGFVIASGVIVYKIVKRVRRGHEVGVR